MKKNLLFIILVISIPVLSSAQALKGYTASAGIKFGKFSSGLSGKLFFGTNNANAIEMNLTMKKNFGTIMSTVFYERQQPVFNSSLRIPLDYIWGAGAHIAYYQPGYYKVRKGDKDEYYDEGVSMGIDFKLGLEHLFSFVPITVAIEACPMIDLVNPGPEHIEIAISFRYVIGSVSRNAFKRR